MSSVMSAFKVALVVMGFYAVAITLIVYSLPSDAVVQSYNGMFDPGNDYSLQSISSVTEDALDDSSNVPSIDVGALVFYSGNVVVDMLLNFVTAVPQMIGLFLNGVNVLINIDPYMVDMLQLFFTAVVVALYIIGLIQLLTGVRSGGRLVG